MPRAKTYPGKVVRNKRYHNKKMHMVAWYRTRGQTVGIYSDAFDVLVDIIVERYRNDLQSVIVFEGGTGSGKSTASIGFVHSLCKALDIRFDFEHDYIYDLEDLWEKLETRSGSVVSLFDEGAVTLSSGNAMRREDKDMVSLFNTMRSRHWITIINIPSIGNLNKAVTKVHADFKIHCNDPDKPIIKGYSRGFAEISEAQRNEFSKNAEPYWNLLFTGIFRDLPKKVKDIYLPIKSESQDRLIDDIIARSRDEDKPKRPRKKGQPKPVPSDNGEDIA